MPAATEQPAAKKEREDLLWQALKEHIMLERQKKKEEQEAEVEEERLRKEREERDRQDAMSLDETREQIQLMDARLEDLKNEKQQLFLRLKKVLNEDENRKKQQQQKDSEMFALQNMVPQPGPHPQVFLPPRAPHQHLMQKYLQSVPPISNAPPPNKRGRSPSPTLSGYYKPSNSPYSQNTKHEDGRRGAEVTRTVLWNKPTYQNPPGTLYYPPTAQENRGQPMIIGGYTSYPPMIPLHQGGGGGYHVELQPGPPNQPPPIVQSQPPKGETKTIPGGAQVYHINLDPSSGPPSQSSSSQQPSGKGPPPSSQPPPPSSVSHGKGHGPPQPQITMEKLNDRAYHPSHLPEGMYRMPMLGIPPPMPPSAGQQMQPVKPGGSISQGYSRANPSSGGPPSAAPPPPPQSQASQQPGQPPQMHYQRRY